MRNGYMRGGSKKALNQQSSIDQEGWAEAEGANENEMGGGDLEEYEGAPSSQISKQKSNTS